MPSRLPPPTNLGHGGLVKENRKGMELRELSLSRAAYAQPISPDGACVTELSEVFFTRLCMYGSLDYSITSHTISGRNRGRRDGAGAAVVVPEPAGREGRLCGRAGRPRAPPRQRRLRHRPRRRAQPHVRARSRVGEWARGCVNSALLLSKHPCRRFFPALA